MAKIGVLLTGANVTTSLALSWVPQFIMITSAVAANILKAVSIVVDGNTVQNVQGLALVGSVMKYLQESSAGAVALLWKVSSGFIGGQTCQINLTNNGVTTPDVFAFSGRKNGVPYLVGMQTAQANTSVLFRNFTALFFVSTNFDSAQVRYSDGHYERLNAVEVAGLFTIENESDANGLLNACHVIDNKFNTIESVEIYANAVGALDVAQLTINR